MKPRGRGRRGGRGRGRGRDSGELSTALVPVDDELAMSDDETALALSEKDPKFLARRLLKQFRGQRSGWLGHFRSFVGVNAGLAAINVLTSIGSEGIYPWFLYVTASWGIGLVIHGMTYRGWVKERTRSIEQAEEILEASRFDRDLLLPAPSKKEKAPPSLSKGESEPLPALPQTTADDDWSELIHECEAAVDAAHGALDQAGVEPDVADSTRDQLAKGLRTVEVVRRGAQAIQLAIQEVAPSGLGTLEGEILALESRISKASDERLKGVYGANLGLLEARRDKLRALMAEEERMRATTEGFLLAAQNVRLDAARLGAGHVPGKVAALGDSLERLDQEVEVVRQVEQELEML